MESRELLRTNLARSRDLVLMRIEDMRGHALIAPTPRGGGHTLWVLGHLAYTEYRVVRVLMRGEPHPLAAWERMFDGDDVSADAATFPPFDDALAACRAARARTLELLEALSEPDLDQPSARVPAGFESLFGTWRDCLQYVADHWLMHRGTLADARRAAGVPRMWV